MGRWVYAHGFVQFLKLTTSVVLKVAGLPEPSQQKPDDTMPFLLSEKSMESFDKVTELTEVTQAF